MFRGNLEEILKETGKMKMWRNWTYEKLAGTEKKNRFL